MSRKFHWNWNRWLVNEGCGSEHEELEEDVRMPSDGGSTQVPQTTDRTRKLMTFVDSWIKKYNLNAQDLENLAQALEQRAEELNRTTPFETDPLDDSSHEQQPTVGSKGVDDFFKV